jgi:hypothetical protein
MYKITMDNQSIYIKERMDFYAMNIDQYSINQDIYDNGDHCTITNKTKNSIEVYHKKKTINGINCKQWYTMTDFNKRFTT